MGKEKHMEKVKKLFEKSPVVEYGSVERIVKNKKKSSEYAKQILGYLLSKGKIKRLTKGYYTSRDNISLSVFAFKPAYLGLQDAMSFYDLWEQETIPVILTSRKVRQGIRKVMGKNILIRRIKKKYLFGYEEHLQEGVALPYSSVEKTFIDMVYFNENLSEEALKNFKNRIEVKKLEKYLKKYPLEFRKRVKTLYGKI